MNEPWLHSIDLELWKGEDRNSHHANEMSYDRSKISNFIYEFITETGTSPDVHDILHCLGLSSRYTDDVRITLSNYDHEEEVEYRESL